MKKLILLLIVFNYLLIAQIEMRDNKDLSTNLINIQLDGIVDENEWKDAIKYSDFRQISPGIDTPPSEKTTALVLYDQDYLYFAFVMEASEVFGTVVERDVSFFLDDYVTVFIDSYNDKSNALFFSVNPLGARVDSELIDNGYRINKAWNTFWDSKAVKTKDGWSCEFRIPFSSLRFEANENVVMNLRFERLIKHTNEKVIYPLLDTSLDKLDQNMFNSVEFNFKNITGETPIYLTPYISGNIVQNSELNSEGTSYINKTSVLDGKEYINNSTLDKIISPIGFDLKYKLNNSNTLDLTVNTDFAQAEADAQVFNLTRYSIYLPEKRQFFLENAGLFSANMFDHRLFQSRRIGIENGHNIPILAGIRMTGVYEGIQYGLLNMQTNGIESKHIDAKNFSVFRFRKGLKQDDSYLGGIFTNKISTEKNDYNRQAAIDGIYRLSSSITTSFFGALTYDTGLTNTQNGAYGLGFSKLYQSEGLEFDFSLVNYEQNFNPEMGFLSIPNSIQSKARVGWGFLLPNDSFLSKILVGSYNRHFLVSSSREKLFHQSYLYTVFSFRDGSLLQVLLPWYQEDKLHGEWKFSSNITIPAEKYKSWLYEFWYQSGYTKNYNWFVNGVWGDFYGGKQLSLWSGINYIFNEKIRMSGEISYYKIDFPTKYSSNGNETEYGVILKHWLTYNFAPDLSLNMFSQYNSVSKKVGSNLRLRYNPLEGTDFYLVYNSVFNTDRNRFNPHLSFIDQQKFIIKFSKTLIL